MRIICMYIYIYIYIYIATVYIYIYIYIYIYVDFTLFNIAVMSLTVLQCISANFSQVIAFFKMRYEVQIHSCIPFSC